MRTPTSLSAFGRFEHDHRNAASGRPRLVLLVAGVEVRRELPEPFALGALGLAGDVPLSAAVSARFVLRVHLHVVIPCGRRRAGHGETSHTSWRSSNHSSLTW